MVLFFTFRTKKINEDYSKKIDILESKIDSLNLKNKQIDQKLVTNNKEYDRLEDLVAKNVKNITIIKENTYEKINVIDGFNVVQLSEFFTKRYNDTTGLNRDN